MASFQVLPSTTAAGASTSSVLFDSGASHVVGQVALDPSKISGFTMMTKVTAASSLAGDTLTVYLQHSMDGVNYTDFLATPAFLGNGGALQSYSRWARDSSFTITSGGSAYLGVDGGAAGAINFGEVGQLWRLKWVSVGTGSFTFQVFMAINHRTR